MSGFHQDITNLAPEGIVVSRLDVGHLIEPGRPATAARIGFTSLLARPCNVVVRVDQATLALIQAKSPFADEREPMYTEKKSHILLVIDSFEFVEKPRACNQIFYVNTKVFSKRFFYS